MYYFSNFVFNEMLKTNWKFRNCMNNNKMQYMYYFSIYIPCFNDLVYNSKMFNVYYKEQIPAINFR